MKDCREVVRLRRSDRSARREDLLQLLMQANRVDAAVEHLEAQSNDENSFTDDDRFVFMKF